MFNIFYTLEDSIGTNINVRDDRKTVFFIDLAWVLENASVITPDGRTLCHEYSKEMIHGHLRWTKHIGNNG